MPLVFVMFAVNNFRGKPSFLILCSGKTNARAAASPIGWSIQRRYLTFFTAFPSYLHNNENHFSTYIVEYKTIPTCKMSSVKRLFLLVFGIFVIFFMQFEAVTMATRCVWAGGWCFQGLGHAQGRGAHARATSLDHKQRSSEPGTLPHRLNPDW
jgi:hypothetical protein